LGWARGASYGSDRSYAPEEPGGAVLETYGPLPPSNAGNPPFPVVG
jgi:hypothetical protein